MKWQTAIYMACGLAIAALVNAVNLSATRSLIALACGFLALVTVESVIKRRLKRKAPSLETGEPTQASVLERNILHAYREPGR